MGGEFQYESGNCLQSSSIEQRRWVVEQSHAQIEVSRHLPSSNSHAQSPLRCEQ